MKKFTIFGFKFLFEVKKKDNSDEEKYSDTYFLKEKVFLSNFGTIFNNNFG